VQTGPEGLYCPGLRPPGPQRRVWGLVCRMRPGGAEAGRKHHPEGTDGPSRRTQKRGPSHRAGRRIDAGDTENEE